MKSHQDEIFNSGSRSEPIEDTRYSFGPHTARKRRAELFALIVAVRRPPLIAPLW
jgi:hypothetical protein